MDNSPVRLEADPPTSIPSMRADILEGRLAVSKAIRNEILGDIESQRRSKGSSPSRGRLSRAFSVRGGERESGPQLGDRSGRVKVVAVCESSTGGRCEF
jgi:hypothetical protein